MSNVVVAVRDGNIMKALRHLRKKCEVSGVFRDIKRKVCYTPPGEQRRLEHRRALHRARKGAKSPL
jgi:ribosomal protein S21